MTPSTTTPELLTAADVAEILRCSRRHAYNLFYRGRLAVTYAAGERSPRTTREEVNRLIREGFRK